MYERFLIVGGWPETGFLREYLVTGEEMGKNPVSLVLVAIL